jgi:hypothetical protein
VERRAEHEFGPLFLAAQQRVVADSAATTTLSAARKSDPGFFKEPWVIFPQAELLAAASFSAAMNYVHRNFVSGGTK